MGRVIAQSVAGKAPGETAAPRISRGFAAGLGKEATAAIEVSAVAGEVGLRRCAL